MPTTPPTRLAIFAALLAVVAPAAAQDALGTGNALDGNTRVGSSGVNTAVRRPNYAARNLLVTGDVPGGRGFRGSVGYRAAGDFVGTLGSDDLFQFRATSAFSAPSAVRYGATVQNLRFGEQLGTLSFRRDSSTSLSALQPSTPSTGAEWLADTMRLDRLIQSTSITEPLSLDEGAGVIGQSTDADGDPITLRISSLRGITVQPRDDQPRPLGLTEYDWLRLRQDETEGRQLAAVGTPYETRFDRLAGLGAAIDPGAVETAGDPGLVVTRLASSRVDEHEDILARVAERFVEQADAETDEAPVDPDQATAEQLAELKVQYDQLKERLRLGPTGLPMAGDDPPVQSQDGDRDDPLAPAPIDDSDRVDVLRRRGLGAPTGDAAGIDRFGIVLRHGERIDRLASSNEGRFNELLRSAEDRLRRGEYFWAERRFIRALRFVPGHPLATAGLGHAQLGAGLYDSASLTLRSLLTHQPEMIDTRYDAALLPNHVRLLAAIEEIRRPSEMSRGVGTGFLLAYIGHQLEDDALVAEGLGVIADADPDDALLPLLRRVWGAAPEAGDETPPGP